MANILKAASDAFSDATKPIENAVNSIPGVKEGADDASKAITGKPWREGLANDVRTGALGAAGQAVAGPEGAAAGAAAGETLRN